MKDNDVLLDILFLAVIGSIIIGTAININKFTNAKVDIIKPVEVFIPIEKPIDNPLTEPLVAPTNSPPTGQEFKNTNFKYGYWAPAASGIGIGGGLALVGGYVIKKYSKYKIDQDLNYISYVQLEDK